jgi:DNA-binding NarL/FixJ family response regulator
MIDRRLTPAQQRYVTLFVQGKRDRDIAAEMGLDHRTIATYKRDILKKYGLSGPQELMLWAIRESLVQDYRHVPSGAADATHV